MTPEERDKRLVPELTYSDYVQQLDDLPAFNREQAYSDWQSGKKPILDALMSNYVKPERQITPEQAKRAKTAAAISDSLATLAQMFAYSQGARVRNPQGRTSMQTTNERLRAMQDKYEQDMLRYGTARTNAEMQDFNQYLRDAMNAHGQRRQNILYKAQRAQQIEQARAKAAADEAKYKRDQADKTAAADKKFERDMALVRERAKYRSSGGGGGARASAAASKNIFEIPVTPGTQGAEYDDYTGRTYLKQEIPPERQATIISNLPGGKQQYIIKNKLYKTYSYTDDFGKLREQVVPFSDAEIIKWYLENDYYNRAPQSPASGQQRQSAPEWKIPKANLANPNKSAGQPRFNHSPY